MENQRFSRLASQCNCHNTPFAPNNIAKRPNHEKTEYRRCLVICQVKNTNDFPASEI